MPGRTSHRHPILRRRPAKHTRRRDNQFEHFDDVVKIALIARFLADTEALSDQPNLGLDSLQMLGWNESEDDTERSSRSRCAAGARRLAFQARAC